MSPSDVDSGETPMTTSPCRHGNPRVSSPSPRSWLQSTWSSTEGLFANSKSSRRHSAECQHCGGAAHCNAMLLSSCSCEASGASACGGAGKASSASSDTSVGASSSGVLCPTGDPQDSQIPGGTAKAFTGRPALASAARVVAVLPPVVPAMAAEAEGSAKPTADAWSRGLLGVDARPNGPSSAPRPSKRAFGRGCTEAPAARTPPALAAAAALAAKAGAQGSAAEFIQGSRCAGRS
mmetsp:Transcript_36599/g.101600  ORF Transcript_36599/g.101600 Transcript_36599/m.101600 type:complete len:236 (+) Transcript_36599:545-1252(+)